MSSISTSVSDAALATLHSNDLSSDLLLTLVVLVSSPLQLLVKETPECALQLVAKNGTWTLTQRNAIVRWVAGLGLHNAVDRATGLLGGCSDSAQANPTAAIAIAEISSWMVMADSFRKSRSSSTDVLDGWAQQVDAFLSHRAYLVPAAKPTLADFDLAFAFLEQAPGDNTWRTLISKYAHLQRWIDQCLATALDLVYTQNQLNNRDESRLQLSSSFTDIIHRHSGNSVKSVCYTPQFFLPKDIMLAPSANYQASRSEDKSPSASSSKKLEISKEDKKKTKNDTKEIPQGSSQQPKRATSTADPTSLASIQTISTPTVQNAGETCKDIQTMDSFNISSLDIRVGQIVRCWPHESADKLYCEEILLGEDQPRLIASGLRPFYSLEEMQNQRVLVLANLKARNLVGFPSHGMVLCASNQDHTNVEFVVPPDTAKIGERVMFEGFDGLPEPENKVAKKKILEQVLPHLMTNDDGVVTWKGAKSITSVGACRASKGMTNAHVA